MSKCLVIGCLHLGDEGVAKWRGFSDSYEHDEWLIMNWNSVVNKRDKVFILGDITKETSEHYYKLDLLRGSKEVCLGNHDLGRDIPELLKYVDKVAGAIDYKDYILTHFPIHPNEVHFYKANIHSHIHHDSKLETLVCYDRYKDRDSILTSTEGKYINVDAHLLGYKPISFEEINNRI